MMRPVTVATAALGDPAGPGSRAAPRDLREVRDAHVAAPGRGRLVFLTGISRSLGALRRTRSTGPRPAARSPSSIRARWPMCRPKRASCAACAWCAREITFTCRAPRRRARSRPCWRCGSTANVARFSSSRPMLLFSVTSGRRMDLVNVHDSDGAPPSRRFRRARGPQRRPWSAPACLAAGRRRRSGPSTRAER